MRPWPQHHLPLPNNHIVLPHSEDWDPLPKLANLIPFAVDCISGYPHSAQCASYHRTKAILLSSLDILTVRGRHLNGLRYIT